MRHADHRVCRHRCIFPSAKAILVGHGVEVIDLDLPECVAMMEEFIAAEPALWNEDIGE